MAFEKKQSAEPLEAIPVPEEGEQELKCEVTEYFSLHDGIDALIQNPGEGQILLNEDSFGNKQELRLCGDPGAFGVGMVIVENGQVIKFIKVMKHPEEHVNEEGEVILGVEKGYYEANHVHYQLVLDYIDKNKDILREKVMTRDERDEIKDMVKKIDQFEEQHGRIANSDEKSFIAKITLINTVCSKINNYRERALLQDPDLQLPPLELPFPKFHSIFITEKDKRVCTAVDYMEGPTLRKAENIDTPKEKSQIIRGIIKKLHLLHQQGYVHGDLKNDNIMLSQGDPLLIDNGFVHDFTAENRGGVYELMREWRSFVQSTYNSLVEDLWVICGVKNNNHGMSKPDIRDNMEHWKNLADTLGIDENQSDLMLFVSLDDKLQKQVFELAGIEGIDETKPLEELLSSGDDLESLIMSHWDMLDKPLTPEQTELFEKIKQAIAKGLPLFLEKL